MRRRLPMLLVGLLAGGPLGTASHHRPAGLAAEPEGRPAIRFERDVIYGRAGGEALKLDLARPATGKGSFPLVIFVHGGAWMSGSKAQYDEAIRDCARRGYVAATVDYRLAPKHRFPAQIEDVQRAVRWLRGRARELRIDPGRVGVVGDSAGGHLALLLGLMDPPKGQGGSGPVQAVVSYFGPTDLRHWRISPIIEPFVVKAFGKTSRGVISDFLGTSDPRAPMVAKASPITYVGRGDPPILTLHGTRDPLVPIDQAERLHRALRAAGVPETLVRVEGAMHGWGGAARERTDRITREFLGRHLKGREVSAPGRPRAEGRPVQ